MPSAGTVAIARVGWKYVLSVPGEPGPETKDGAYGSAKGQTVRVADVMEIGQAKIAIGYVAEAQ